MRTLRALAVAPFVALALMLTACSLSQSDSNDSAPILSPSSDQGRTNGVSTTPGDGAEGGTSADNGQPSPSDNTADKKDPRYNIAKPCKVINAADLYTIFHSTFKLIDDDDPNNGDDSPVVDKTTQSRNCAYTTPNAMLDDGNRTKFGDLQLVITTKLDDTKGTDWDGYIYSAKVNDGTVLSDSSIQFGTGWFVMRFKNTFGDIIVEVQDQNGQLNDKGAQDILSVASKRLR